MKNIYYLLLLTLISLVFPAWIISRQADPALKAKGAARSFQVWFLTGWVWLAVSFAVHAFIMIGGIIGEQQPVLQLLGHMVRLMIFAGWLPNCMIGALLWFSYETGDHVRFWHCMCIVFNSAVVLMIRFPDVSVTYVILGMTVLAIWILLLRMSLRVFTRERSIYALLILVGSAAGGMGALLYCFGGFITPVVADYGKHLYITGGGMSLAAGCVFYIVEKITGIAVYSKALMYCTLAVLCLWCPWSFMVLEARQSAYTTVLGVGMGFTGLLIGANLWMAFARLKEKTIDELSAHWETLGAWMPSGITARFVAFGGWCLFIGSILFSLSSFQNISRHLMPTLWGEGLIRIIIIGGIGSFYCAASYGAWSETSSTPDPRVAEIGYWHFMGGSILMWSCFLAGGLTAAAQKVLHTSMNPNQIFRAGLTQEAWQRPFLAGIGIADIMVFASILIMSINLFRARNSV